MAVFSIAMLAWAAASVSARPGGGPRGGAGAAGRRPGGDARRPDAAGEGRHLGNREDRPGGPINGQAFNHNLAAAHGLASTPFSPGWYSQHPQAWTHPHADAFAVASLAGATAWLGLAATQPAVSYSTVYETNSDGTVPATEAQTAAAAQLAHTGITSAESSAADWLPLGVYALSQTIQADNIHVMQLAVNKEGIIRGTYFDALSDADHALQGAVDKKSQRVAWTIGSQGTVVFQTALADLTNSSAPVSLHFEDGQTRMWNLVRLANPAPSNERDAVSPIENK